MKAQAPQPVHARDGPAPAVLRPLVLVGGKGGVGKTTIASALALAIAAEFPKKRVLLLSTDPAHSLHDIFNSVEIPPNLRITEADARGVIDAFRRQHEVGLRKIVLRGTFLDDTDVEHFLDLGLPGLDELAGLEVIADVLRGGDTDHLLVDTAPTGHTLRLLSLPDTLEAWRDALESLMAKHRLMARLYAGHYVRDEADAFIRAIVEILTVFRSHVACHDRAAFLPVMNADPLAFFETRRLLGTLDALGMSAPRVVINKVVAEPGDCRLCRSLYDREREWVKRIRREIPRDIVEIPSFLEEPRNREDLEAMGRFLLQGETTWVHAVKPGSDGECPGHSGTPHWRATSLGKKNLRALKKAKLCLAAGKGGVGKTTVAAALALWYTRRPEPRVLLFSIDPAHSLSDVLGVTIGEKPVEVTENLTAIEINPEKRLAYYKATYLEDLGLFFDSLTRSNRIQANLDREAMEHLIDLSPPGLDEIIALADLARILREGRFDRVVVDSAPTGHLLRFLELPDLMRGWMRAFFEIFLKYRRLLRAPRTQDFLIDLSRSIEEVQAIFRNENQALLIAVAIPTVLSLEETVDLFDRTRDFGMSPRFGILNHMTPAHEGCPTCSRRATVADEFLARYRETLPDVEFLCLAEQEESPTGVQRLQQIARELFG